MNFVGSSFICFNDKVIGGVSSETPPFLFLNDVGTASRVRKPKAILGKAVKQKESLKADSRAIRSHVDVKTEK